MADDIAFTPVLADPPPPRRGHGRGKPEGPAKQLARQHPNQWVLVRLRHGHRRGHGMLDSASEWQVAIRWLDGAEFGIDGPVTATYIKHVPAPSPQGISVSALARFTVAGDIAERGQQPAAGRPAPPKPSSLLPTAPPPAANGWRPAVADIGLHSADTTGDRSQPGAWFVYGDAADWCGRLWPLALFDDEAAARRWCDESGWGLVVWWPFGKEWDENDSQQGETT